MIVDNPRIVSPWEKLGRFSVVSGVYVAKMRRIAAEEGEKR